jgi:class I fructose-bisphosphate aldolase
MIGKAARFSRIMKRGKVMLCAMDQGLEHGPRDFNEQNIDPDYVLEVASKCGFTGMVLHKGVALKYFEPYAGKVPLVLKLNGRTNIVPKEEIYSSPVASVRDAVAMGADAVGYTLYVGSPSEAQMFEDFAMIEQEARDYGMPVIVWSYPRGKYVADEKSVESVSYAARVALELGADIVKVNYTGSTESFKKVVAAAQKCRVISAGGSKQTDAEFLAKAREVMAAGAAGFAVGRNVWQNEDPSGLAESLRKVIWGKE